MSILTILANQENQMSNNPVIIMTVTSTNMTMTDLRFNLDLSNDSNFVYLLNFLFSVFSNHLIEDIRWGSIISISKLHYIIPIIFGTAKWEMFIFFHTYKLNKCSNSTQGIHCCTIGNYLVNYSVLHRNTS